MGLPLILFVSANQSQASLFRIHLKQAGYDVFQIARGENILATLKHANPQLAIVDWDLPDMSALAVTRAVRMVPGYARLPIILSGRAISSENKILALEAGADLCLDGIVTPNELVARVRAMLRRVKVPVQVGRAGW